MKKYTRLFKLSFITYIIVIFASPYITAQTWADLCLLFFIISIIYQLVYIGYLRKKDDVKIGKSISNYFFYTMNSISGYIILYYIKNFIYGYDNNPWYDMIYFPWLFINGVLMIIHFIKKKK